MSVTKRLNSSQGKRERVHRDTGLLSRMLTKTGNSSIHFFSVFALGFILANPGALGATPTREESLRYVGDGYENLMLQMLYDQMKQSQSLWDDGQDNPFAPSNAEKIFQSMRDQDMITQVSKRRPLGVSDMIVKSLKGDGGVSSKNLLK